MHLQSVDASVSNLPSHDVPSPLPLTSHSFLHQLLILSLFFAALAPTLPWQEFTGGMENVTVATALETARDGHWLVPTLHGQPRIKKPPFAHWLGALGILSSDSLPWGARWPTLLCACIFLLSVYHLGRILGGPSIALAAAFIAGSSFLFLNHARQASYDIPLAMWVGLANVFIALAVFQQRWWLGCCAAGICIGLAILTKGPVSLLQTLLPLAFYILLERLSGRRVLPQRFPLFPVLAGLLAILLVALPWYVYLFFNVPGVGQAWLDETTFKNERLSENRAPWYDYLQFVPMMAPWAIWLVIGMIALVTNHPYKHNRRLGLAFLWIFVPIVIMSFLHVKRSRYLVPLISPASILVAWGLLVHLPGWLASKSIDKVLATIHWILLAVPVVVLALLGSTGWFGVVTLEGKPWYSITFAAGFVVVLGAILLASALLYRRWIGSLVLGSVVVMLLLQALFMWGYRQCASGRSEGRVLAQHMLLIHPDARIFSYHPDDRDPPLEMPIYLNRAVHKISDTSKIIPASYPQMILIPAKSKEDAPPTPPHYRYLDHAHVGGTWWYVYGVLAASEP